MMLWRFFLNASYSVNIYFQVKSENKSYENGELKDEALRQSPEEIMATGGCRYRNGPVFNGQEWHPNVYPHGEQKCVLCRCKVRQSTNYYILILHVKYTEYFLFHRMVT